MAYTSKKNILLKKIYSFFCSPVRKKKGDTDAFAEYWVWHELVLSWVQLRKTVRTRRGRKKLRVLTVRIIRHYFRYFVHFPVWLFRLLTPSYFKGEVTVWTNLRTIIKSPDFKPLRLAVVSHFTFLVIVVQVGLFIFYHLPSVDAATYGWIQTNWSSVSTTATASHTTDRTGWTTFSSSTLVNFISSPGDILLATSTYSTTDDGTLSTNGVATGGGFSNGVTVSTTVSGSGSAAEVSLAVASAGGEILQWDSSSYDLPATISGTEDGNGAMVTDGSDAFYILRGGGTTGFYKFVPSDKSTSTLASVPSNIPPNGGGGAMVLSGNYVYVYSGGNSGPKFYAYSISDNSWTTLTNPPSSPYGDGIGSTMATDADGNIYFAAGGATPNFFKYTVTSSAPFGSWSTAYTLGSSVGRGSRAMYDAENNDILILTGNNGHMISKFDIDTNAVTNYSGAPNDPGYTSGAFMVKNDDNDIVYSITGQNYAWLERLNLNTGTWAGRQTSSTPASGNTVGYMLHKPGESRIYVTFGGTTFYYLNPYTAQWTSNSIPGSVGRGATMIRHNNDEIYVLAGGNTNAMYRFAINAGTQYHTAGTLTSATIDLKYATSTRLSWSASAHAQTGAQSVKFQVAANNDNSTWNYIGPDGTAGTYFTASDTALHSSLNGNRYYRYRVFLSTANASFTPVLNSVTFTYHGYVLSGNLISSPLNAEDDTNVLAAVSWNGTAPAGTSIRFQVRTSPNSSSWTGWMGPDGTASTYFTDSSGAQDMPPDLSDGIDDRWIQYRVFLESDGTGTPVLAESTLVYVVNAPPEITITNTVEMNAQGVVEIHYDVRDIDSSTGSTPGIVAVDLQYCTANCSTPGGETWVTATGTSISGDIGPSVSVDTVSTTQYTSHTVMWTPSSSYNNQYNGTNFKIRLRANDSEAANNIGVAESNTFILDTTDPVVSIVVDGRSTTAETLTISVTDNTSSGLEMRLSNHSGLSPDGINQNSGTWIPYTPTSTWNLGTGGTTVYYQVRDIYGNVSSNGAISSAQTPQIPGNLFFKDISNSDTAEWREFIAWQIIDEPASGFAEYTIYRSTDGVTYAPIGSQISRIINYYLDTAVDTGTVYYYKVTAEDQDGNISSYSTVVSDDPNGTGGTDVSAPSISSVATSSLGPSFVTITWETDEVSDSYVDYVTVPGGDFDQAETVGSTIMKNTASGLGVHSVVVTGLTPETTYYFRVRSIDPDGNQGIGLLPPDGYSFTTLSGPIISNISTTEVRNTQATITWNTDQETDSYIVFSTSSNFTASTTVGSPTLTTAHEVTLPSLLPNTTYFYYVQSGLGVDKNTIGGQDQYYSFKTTADLTAPQISFNSGTDILISDTSFVITFDTDEVATSTLEYGTSDEYGSVVSNSGLNSNHHIELNGLLAGTTYYFSLRVADREGNQSSPLEFSATTTDSADYTPPVISGVETRVVTDDEALLLWNTDEAATGIVYYGTTSSLYTTSSAFISTYNQAHSIILSGLTTSTEYFYIVVSGDVSGNVSTSSEYSFTTLEQLSEESEVLLREEAARAEGYQQGIDEMTPPPDETAPVISSVQAIVVTDDNAMIGWTTNEGATGIVYYGTTSSEYVFESDLASSYNRTHAILLSNLSTSTEYFYIVVSADESGNTTTSSEHTFTTLEQLSEESEVRLREEIARAEGYQQGIDEMTPPPDETAPVLSNIGIEVVTDREALVVWTTNESANGAVYYGISSSVYSASHSLSSVYTQAHTFVLSNLSTSTEYFYIVVSADESGNTTTSSEHTFTTLEQLSEESEVLLREEAARAEGVAQGSASQQSSGGGGGGGSVAVDITPPTIIDFTINPIESTRAVMKWRTNENANALVEFGTTLNYGRGALDLQPGQEHEVELIELVPLTTYYYRVSSYDISGNRSIQTIGSFKTSAFDEEEILDDEEGVVATSTQSAEEMFLSTMQKAADIIKSLSSRVSVNVLESGLIEQARIIEDLSNILPLPIIGGQPAIEIGSNYATIAWTTDKLANSLVEFAPADVFARTGSYDQTVGAPFAYNTRHGVEIKGLLPDTVYHYRVISRTQTGSETKSQDFIFRTDRQNTEIVTYKVDTQSTEQAVFSWITTVPTDSVLTYTPYRNGQLHIEARQTVRSAALTTQHSLQVAGFEAGVLYDVELSGSDSGNNVVSRTIQGFTTEGEDLPPVISQIKTDSAIIAGGKEKIQAIISWTTNELSTSRVYYRKGFASGDAEFTNSTPQTQSYVKKHIVVITDFEPGQVYQFVVESVDSTGNAGRSKTVSVLTPRKEESVFQVIMSNFEGIFSWVGRIRN